MKSLMTVLTVFISSINLIEAAVSRPNECILPKQLNYCANSGSSSPGISGSWYFSGIDIKCVYMKSNGCKGKVKGFSTSEGCQRRCMTKDEVIRSLKDNTQKPKHNQDNKSKQLGKPHTIVKRDSNKPWDRYEWKTWHLVRPVDKPSTKKHKINNKNRSMGPKKSIPPIKSNPSIKSSDATMNNILSHSVPRKPEAPLSSMKSSASESKSTFVIPAEWNFGVQPPAKPVESRNDIAISMFECQLPKMAGCGKEELKRWYFKEGNCEEFIYLGGCANQNIFSTQEDCMRKCGTQKELNKFLFQMEMRKSKESMNLPDSPILETPKVPSAVKKHILESIPNDNTASGNPTIEQTTMKIKGKEVDYKEMLKEVSTW